MFTELMAGFIVHQEHDEGGGEGEHYIPDDGGGGGEEHHEEPAHEEHHEEPAHEEHHEEPAGEGEHYIPDDSGGGGEEHHDEGSAEAWMPEGEEHHDESGGEDTSWETSGPPPDATAEQVGQWEADSAASQTDHAPGSEHGGEYGGPTEWPDGGGYGNDGEIGRASCRERV